VKGFAAELINAMHDPMHFQLSAGCSGAEAIRCDAKGRRSPDGVDSDLLPLLLVG
jgi:hypothetical protein